MKQEIRIGIIGCRARNTQADLKCLALFLISKLKDLDLSKYEIKFVSGGCPKGGDHFAEVLASMWKIPIIIHYPDKSKLPDPYIYSNRDYRKICFERNTLIARDSMVLIALVKPGQDNGTRNTIETFKKMYPKGTVYEI